MSLEHAPQRDDGKPLQAPLADDLLIGAAAIAQELGRNKAAVSTCTARDACRSAN
jgi:hypothetical protein